MHISTVKRYTMLTKLVVVANVIDQLAVHTYFKTRRPSSADRTARRQFQAAFPVITGSFPTNAIAHLRGLSMDLTAGRTVGPTVDSTVGWTVGLTVYNCVNIGLTVDPTVEITDQPVSRKQAIDASDICHGCRAMRRSVCSARASNGGRSICVQISWERTTPCQHIDTTRKAIHCATTLLLTVLYNETLQQTLLSKLSERLQI